MKRQLIFVIALAILCGLPAAGYAAEPQAEFTTNTITIRNVTPGADVVFFGVAGIPLPERYLRQIKRWQRVVADSDHDGVVTFDAGQAIPADSVWVIADTTNAHYVVAHPQAGREHGLVENPGALVREQDGSDAFVFPGRAFDLLYLHPGHGVWAWVDVVRSPGTAGREKGVASAVLADAKQLAGSDKPSTFAPGGLLVAIDDSTLKVQISRVTGNGGLQ